VADVYRVGETEVFVVSGGSVQGFDLPAVRAFIRIFAPRRGEIVVDADVLDLRPVRDRSSGQDRPRAPRRRSRRAAVDATSSGPVAATTEGQAPAAPSADEPPPTDAMASQGTDA